MRARHSAPSAGSAARGRTGGRGTAGGLDGSPPGARPAAPVLTVRRSPPEPAAPTAEAYARRMSHDAAEETERARRLLDAQAKAEDLFRQVQKRGLLAPGETEKAVSDRIRDLAGDLYGVRRFWHKRIVRSGPHTLHPYRENPPDRLIEEDDILFADFGPIFEEWEADFGRTFVLGDDPAKLRLRDALPEIFAAGRRVFEADPRHHRRAAARGGRASRRGGGLGVRRSPLRPPGRRVPAREDQR
jgi:hypothetical protein